MDYATAYVTSAAPDLETGALEQLRDLLLSPMKGNDGEYDTQKSIFKETYLTLSFAGFSRDLAIGFKRFLPPLRQMGSVMRKNINIARRRTWPVSGMICE